KGAQQRRRDGADWQRRRSEERDNPLPRAALQLVFCRRGARRRGARRCHRHGLASDGGAGGEGIAPGYWLRVDRNRLSATAEWYAYFSRIRRGGPVRVSRPGREI